MRPFRPSALAHLIFPPLLSNIRFMIKRIIFGISILIFGCLAPACSSEPEPFLDATVEDDADAMSDASIADAALPAQDARYIPDAEVADAAIGCEHAVVLSRTVPFTIPDSRMEIFAGAIRGEAQGAGLLHRGPMGMGVDGETGQPDYIGSNERIELYFSARAYNIRYELAGGIDQDGQPGIQHTYRFLRGAVIESGTGYEEVQVVEQDPDPGTYYMEIASYQGDEVRIAELHYDTCAQASAEGVDR